jgi:hypothetical protein
MTTKAQEGLADLEEIVAGLPDHVQKEVAQARINIFRLAAIYGETGQIALALAAIDFAVSMGN